MKPWQRAAGGNYMDESPYTTELRDLAKSWDLEHLEFVTECIKQDLLNTDYSEAALSYRREALQVCLDELDLQRELEESYAALEHREADDKVLVEYRRYFK